MKGKYLKLVPVLGETRTKIEINLSHGKWVKAHFPSILVHYISRLNGE